eukprot:4246201-Amphidinium_carterae.1
MKGQSPRTDIGITGVTEWTKSAARTVTCASLIFGGLPVEDFLGASLWVGTLGSTCANGLRCQHLSLKVVSNFAWTSQTSSVGPRHSQGTRLSPREGDGLFSFSWPLSLAQLQLHPQHQLPLALHFQHKLPLVLQSLAQGPEDLSKTKTVATSSTTTLLEASHMTTYRIIHHNRLARQPPDWHVSGNASWQVQVLDV